MESTPPQAGERVKTRLMITKMILENFKSYAGAQEIGPFHKRFSSVVGPNGSGKSNVIDALLFVFGKRAKQLRLNKVSELIHKSSGFPNLEYAKVEVHFQLIIDDEESADDFEVVPGSEFIVSRTADQKNQSKYTVDGKGSTYTEVGILLRKHGIDLDNNRFLILQGEVEQIAMMKPKAQSEHEDGLLEYLEDIIGSNQFVEKIGEIGVKLEGLNEQRVDKVNRLKKAEKDRDELSSSKEGAEAYIAREQKIRIRQNVLYQVHESTALDNVRQFTTRKDEAKAQLEHERSKMKDGEKELSALETAYVAKKAEYDAVCEERNGVMSNFAAYERKDLELQENIKHSKTQIDKYRAAVSRDTKKEEESLKVAAEALATVTLARGKIAEAEASKEAGEARLEEIHEGLREATQGLRDSLEGTQAQLADAERATASIQTEKESAETSLQLLQSRSSAAVQAVSTTESKIAALGEDSDKADKKRGSLEQERNELDKKVRAMEAQVGTDTKEEAVLQSSLRAALTSLEAARATLLAQQQEGPKGRSKELDQLMAAAKKGGPLQHAGLRGRLGDLGSIDPEYDVAITTCCGMLDYIVVDTPEGGQACINFLREKNIGRANFVVLEQAGQYRAGMERSQALTLPTGSRRVLDLVTPSDPSLLPVFYMALRDTLVAKDLDSAVAMAYQGGRPVWKVVTLDGNLIDNSGSMSGGGKQARSGGMRLSGTAAPRAITAEIEEVVSPKEIASLEGAVRQCEMQLSQCRVARSNAQATIKDSGKRLKAIEIELEKLGMEIVRISEQRKELTSRVAALKRDTELSTAEKADLVVLQGKISALDEDIARTSPNILTLRRAVTALQQQIRAEGGPKLAQAQSKVDSLVSQLVLLNKKMVENEVAESTNRKQAVKASASRVKGDTDLKKEQEKLSAFQKEVEEMEEDAAVMIDAIAAAELNVETQSAKLEALKTEYDGLDGRMKQVRVVEVRLGEEFRNAERDLKTNSVEAREWRDKLEAVRATHLGEQRTYNANVREVMRVVRSTNASSTGAAALVEEEEEEEETLEVLADLSEEALLAGRMDAEETTREINLFEEERAAQEKKGVNMAHLMEWIKKNGQYRLRLADLEAITLERNSARKEYEALRGQRLEMFMSGFLIITLKLKEMYQMITLGGDAELELLDSLDPFSEGIVFSVRPPKKSWKNISNLSGGEKTLSSLALVFALHHYRPTPLYVMDEIDAALDFKNVSIVANYIKERTKNAQFVIISLRNNMFELADRLVGIYKTHDATKSVTINPRMFAEATTNKGERAKVSVSEGGGRQKAILGDATNIM